MYGEQFSLNNVNFDAYKEACIKYQSAKVDAYSNNEILGFVSKVNYLLPEPVDEIKDSLKKDIKTCANELSKRLSQ